MPTATSEPAAYLDDPDAELVPRLCEAAALKIGLDVPVPELFHLGLLELARLRLAAPPAPTSAAPTSAVDAATECVLKMLRSRAAFRPCPRNGPPRAA